LAILRGSFRSLARAGLPLALVFILSACGGGTKSTVVSTRVVHGPGYSFTAPSGWKTTRTLRTVAVSGEGSSVSVITSTLQKPYRPALFAAATRELDGLAAKLAAEVGKPLSQKQTVEVGGQKIRAYRFGSARVGFFFVDRREYELLCRLPTDGRDARGACALLFESFKAG
jgi:hypothetical protein